LSRKIIIDADPGIGDALATLVALTDPSLDVLAVTATAGTVSGVQATRNLHYLIGLADPLRHPRIGQSDVAIAPSDQAPSEMPNDYSLNGPFGLGDTNPAVPDLHNRRESAKLIVDIAREHPGEVQLVTLGPLTNAAMALDLEPELPQILQSMICLGGAFHAGGNVTAAAEFNFWANPSAASSVLASQVTKFLVPLDVSETPVLTFEDIDRLSGLIPSTPIGESVVAMMHFSVRATHQFLPQEGVALPAVTAIAVAARADSFATEAHAVDIETQGRLTTGTTVMERRPVRRLQSNCDVVTAINPAGIVDYFCRSIRRVAG
jgi:inosine-uridine nucleoside N-ribohydrolase